MTPAESELVAKHVELAHAFAKKKRWAYWPLDIDDLRHLAYMGLIRAAQACTDKEKFKGWAWNYMMRLSYKECRKARELYDRERSLHDNMELAAKGESRPSPSREEVIAAVNTLAGKKRDILLIYLEEGLTNIEIAKRLGIGKSYVSNVMRSAFGKTGDNEPSASFKTRRD